jgi:hypothetical protein
MLVYARDHRELKDEGIMKKAAPIIPIAKPKTLDELILG